MRFEEIGKGVVRQRLWPGLMSQAAFIISAAVGLLAIASFLLPLADRLKLPHSVLLACFGVGLGIASLFFPEWWLVSSRNAFGLSSNALLAVFLPILLFAGGLTIDVRRLLDEFAPILLLAVVAVLVCTLFAGLALHWIFASSLVAALLLGAVVSATDPTCVVSIFRDLGAPRRLSVLVEGESLFNDAAAIALFSIFVVMLGRPTEFGWLDGLWMFLRSFAGGIVVGVAMALLISHSFRLVRDLPTAEITLTIALAYLSYLLSEEIFGVSGVVAVVTASLVLAGVGRTRVSVETWDSLLDTWGKLAFWFSSLIFIFSAMLVPRLLSGWSWQDAGMLAVLIGAALIARSVVVYGLLPALSALRLCEAVTGGHKLVIVWGGLRGGVTLVLALAVIENPLVPVEVERFVAPLATGLVLFTLIVNGPTVRPLLRLLRLDRLSPAEQALRARVMALSRRDIVDQVAQIARDYDIDPQLIDNLPKVDPTAVSEEESGDDGLPLSAEQQLEIGLLALANREGELYLQHFEERTVSSHFAAIGLAQASRIMDKIKTAGLEGYKEAAGGALDLGWRFRLALMAHRETGWSQPLAARLSERFESLVVQKLVLRELRLFNRRSLGPLLGSEVALTLQGVLSDRLDAVKQALTAVATQYPAYVEVLNARYLARSALRLEEREYRIKHRESLISREVYNDLLASITRRRLEVDKGPAFDLGMDLPEMIARVSALEVVPQARLDEVARRLRPRLALPGEQIISKGARGDAMYFIAAGEVEVRTGGERIRLAKGEFFGELALLMRRGRTADVVSKGYTHLLVLEGRDFRRVLKTFPELHSKISKVAEQRITGGSGRSEAD